MFNRQRSSLPYAQGGFPGTLVVFTCIEAVISVLACILSLISLITVRAAMSLNTFLSLGSMAVNTVLSVNLFRGLRMIRNGDHGGAAIASGACKGRRIMLWVVLALEVLAGLIALTQSGGYGFGVLLLTDLILLAIMIPFHFYYKDAEMIFDHISYEESGGMPRSAGVGHFSALCVTFAVLLFAVLVLCATSVLNLNSYLGSYSYSMGDISEFIYMLLFFSIARFLVINKCFLGFKRSHEGTDRETLQPTGHSIFPTICVLASILYGLLFVLQITSLLQVFEYYSRRNSEVVIWRAALTIGFLALSIALTCRPGSLARTGTAVTGSGLVAAVYIYSLVQSFSEGRMQIEFATMLQLVSIIAVIAFYVLALTAALTGRDGKPVQDWMTKALRGMAVGYIAAQAIPLIVDMIDYGYYTFWDIVGYLVSFSITLVAMLGLIRMFSIPAESTAEPMESEWETDQQMQ